MRGVDALCSESLVQSLIIGSLERRAERRESLRVQLDGRGLKKKCELARTL